MSAGEAGGKRPPFEASIRARQREYPALSSQVHARALASQMQLRYVRVMHHARATLRESGYRLTPQRNLIWEVLRGAGRHMTAEEVAREARRTLPDINTSTVYRTLELLVSLDLVIATRLAGHRSYYEVSPEPTHHHFVCTQCGAVGHFGDELLAPVRAELERKERFAVDQIQVTAFGVCPECRGGSSS